MNGNAQRVGRVVAIVGVLLGGYVHLRLYNDGYRDIPNYALGRSFLANVVASGIVVVLLALWRSPLALLAGIGISAGTLGAFVKSRTGAGIFGFAEHGLQPSPEAAIALFAELAAGLICAALLLQWLRRPASRTVNG